MTRYSNSASLFAGFMVDSQTLSDDQEFAFAQMPFHELILLFYFSVAVHDSTERANYYTLIYQCSGHFLAGDISLDSVNWMMMMIV